MAPLSKREVFFIVAIILGLIIGKLIKRVTIGIALGVLLTFMVVMIFSNRKNNLKKSKFSDILISQFLHSENCFHYLISFV